MASDKTSSNEERHKKIKTGSEMKIIPLLNIIFITALLGISTVVVQQGLMFATMGTMK
jgi:hypothetical protein